MISLYMEYLHIYNSRTLSIQAKERGLTLLKQLPSMTGGLRLVYVLLINCGLLLVISLIGTDSEKRSIVIFDMCILNWKR